MKKRKLTASVLLAIFIASVFLTGFAYQPGVGLVYYETAANIYNNATYHEQLAYNSEIGIQRAYFINADTIGTDLKPYVFEGEVTGTYTMDTMVSTLEQQGYKVVAGINGDIFDSDSGTPKGTTIHDYKIKTSGYKPEYVIAFNEAGFASLEKVDLIYRIKGFINAPVYSETETNQDLTPEEQTGQETQIVYIPKEFNAEIGYFNVPYGAAKALHLFNRQYAPSTKTPANSVEVILDAGSPENAELSVGGTITATVVEVRSGQGNTPIGDSQLVISTAADSAYAAQIAQLIPGTQVEVSVQEKEGGNLKNCKEAIGVYYVLYNDNQFVTNGTNLNPRTIIGIKPDGTLMLYVLDGRQPGFATGLGLTDAAKHLVALGCITVVNMDGGGSSVMNVRKAGVDYTAVMKNSPSGKAQRKTTNGLLLVYENKSFSQGLLLHTYPSQPLAMPGADVQLKTYATNESYEPIPLLTSLEYIVDTSLGHKVNEAGIFTAGEAIGTAVIEVRSGGSSTTAKVEIQKDITFDTNVQNLAVEPGESFDINVTAKFGLAPVASKDSLFTWTCDPLIGTIDENGLFQAANESGISGNIYVEYNGQQKIIPVQIGAEIIDFADTKTHWARYAIGKLAARRIVNGMGENLYMPDSYLTRAQFLTMLANTVAGLDVSQVTPAGFTDVRETDWYYDVVNWGYEARIVSGVGNQLFAPDDKITREQMAVMLNNFTNYINMQLPVKSEGITFTDAEKISSWAAEAVNNIISAGVMSGYPEGDYRPQGSATRAEAASVVYRFMEIRDSSLAQ